MRSTRAITSCPQCARHILDAAFKTSELTQATRSTTRKFHQQQAAIWRQRQFSTSAPKQRASSVAKTWSPKAPTQPNMKVLIAQAREKAAREGQMAQDLGLLPDTFILPSDPNIRNNRQLRWHWIKARAGELSLFLATWWTYRRHKIRYNRSKVAQTASEMHERMFSALAAGKIEQERSILSDGLASKLKDRIAARDPSQDVKWALVRDVRKPKLVSYKAMAMTMGAPSMVDKKDRIPPGFIQAVVRIHTVQSLQTMQKQTQKQMKSGRKSASPATTDLPLEARPIEKEAVEYVVLNQSIKDGKAEPWKIWGFTRETTLEDITKAQPV